MLTVTPGDAAQNSFASVDEFKVYRANRFPQVASVLTADDADIEAALIMTGRAMDYSFEWTGVAAVPATQPMTWPRTGMVNRNGYAVASDVSPQALKDAQCEWAYQLLAGGDTVGDNDAEKLGIASVKAGSVAVSFQSKDTSSETAVDVAIRRLGADFNYLNAPGEVRRLLVPSWYTENTLTKPFLLDVYGGSNGTC